MTEDDGGRGGEPGEIERLRQRVAELESRLDARARMPSSFAASFGLAARERILAEAEGLACLGSFAWDARSDTSYWSDELYRILGYSVGEVPPSRATYFAAIHPDDRARIIAASERNVAAATAARVQFRIVRPDGSIRHVEMTPAPVFDEAGHATHFVGAVLDVTDRVETESELRRREEVLKAAQRIARVGSFEWNPTTGETTWSDELYRICGVSPVEPMTFESYSALVHPDDRQRLLDSVSKVQAGQRIGPHEYRILRPDGATVYVYAEASPAYDAEGRPSGWIGTVLDISARKRLEGQLLQSQKMEALGSLAGGIAHDFNNLLTVIGMNVELLQRRRAEPELAEVARVVESAGQLTRRLLAFSRQSVLEHRRVDPVKNVRESLRMMKRVVGEDVQIAFDVARDVGAIAIDPSELEQILLNLLVNARDALPDGGHVTVRLATEHFAEPCASVQPALSPGDYVVLEVADDGVGMDEHVRSRALEPFFTTKEPGRGTGLGLAMVFGIASHAGGGLSLASAKGGGTTVKVYFPVARAEAEDSTLEPPARDRKEGAGELLLLVDDDRTLGRLLARVLGDAGYRVHLAATGDEALAFFDGHAAEIRGILTDVVMPQMGGPELVRRLRARSPDLPALYLSGYAKKSAYDDDPSTRGGFLQKPFTPADLVGKVAEVLARQGKG